MLSGKSNDPAVIVASARPADADGEARLLGPVQAARGTLPKGPCAAWASSPPAWASSPSCASRRAQASTGLADSTAAPHSPFHCGKQIFAGLLPGKPPMGYWPGRCDDGLASAPARGQLDPGRPQCDDGLICARGASGKGASHGGN